MDNSPIFVASATGFLSGQRGVEVVGGAHSAQEAFRMMEQLSPDLILMDIAMPQMDGFEATQRIKAGPNPPLVIILTLHDYPEYRDKAKTIGADGFVRKSDLCTHLLPMIHALFGESAA